MKRSMWAIILTALSSTVTSPLAGQQGVTIDEGTFRITRNGAEVGTETFAIRVSGDGDEMQTLAAARLHLHVDGQSRHLVPRLLMVGPNADFRGYQSKTSGDRQVEVRLEREANRVVAHQTSEQGERMRELRLPESAIVLEPFVAHQFHFVGARLQSGRTTFGLLPVGGSPGGGASAGGAVPESITIAGTAVASTRYTVTAGERSWTVWFDSQWRVLAVTSPNGYRAEREALP